MNMNRRRFLGTGLGLAASTLLASCTEDARWQSPIQATGNVGVSNVSDRSAEVSTGKVEISVPVGTYLAGYAVDVPRASAGVYRPLFVRCTIYWVHGIPNVVVTADVLAFGPSMHQSIRQRVEALGVASSRLVLTATHTHNGPVLVEGLLPYVGYNISDSQMKAVRAYSERLVDTIVGLVGQTLTGPRKPCSLDYQVADEDFSYNREGLLYQERDVPILVARGLSGEPLAVLFGYGCHPVSAGKQKLADPDYPGEAIAVIEAATGAFAQFILGPAGDQNPQKPSGKYDWALRDQQGRQLGQTVANAVQHTGRPVSGPVDGAYRTVWLPFDVTDSPANLAQARAAYVNRSLNTSLAGYIRRHAGVMIREIDAHSFARGLSLPLQVWHLSGEPRLRIAFTGGELVSGYAVHLRAGGRSDALWVSGYANEVRAYIPSDELLYEHPGIHYACGWTADYPGIAGGSMAVYGWIGHFQGRPSGSSVDGVEQILLGGLSDML